MNTYVAFNYFTAFTNLHAISDVTQNHRLLIIMQRFTFVQLFYNNYSLMNE